MAVALQSCVHSLAKEPASTSIPGHAYRPRSPDGRDLARTASPTWLARNGVALIPIVVSPEASAGTLAIADELAAILLQITGARFAIEKGDGHVGIVVGTLAQFPDPALAAALEIHDRFDGREAFAIRTEARRVRLLGATELGASHAAYRFLELIGCRWFFMSPEWTVIPSVRELFFDLEETTRPRVLARQIWFNYGISGERGEADYTAWQRHNRMGQSFSLFQAHVYGAIIEKFRTEISAHPEYYSLVDGKRVPRSLCLSNPAVRAMAVKYARDYLDAHPQADMVSMEPSDGNGFCTCAECAKLGTISDRAFGLANEVARALAQTHPGKLVGLLAYNQHADPPSFSLEPNVHVELAAGLNGGLLPFDRQLAEWPHHSGNRGIYDYLSMYPWGQDRVRPAASSGPAASVSGLAARLRKYIAWGMKSLSGESACNFGKFGLGYYTALRVLWDPGVDERALVDDFYEQAFGPAAPAMRRYYERIDPAGSPLFGGDLLARAYRDVEEAARLASERPDVLARIDQIKLYLHFNYIEWNELASTGDARTKWTLQKLTFVHRTRNLYIVHTAAILGEAPLAKSKSIGKDAPWKVDAPYTRGEIDALFREGLAFFTPRERLDRAFSADVTAVAFGAKPVVGAGLLSLAADLPITLVSLHGEALHFSVSVPPQVSGQALHYRIERGQMVVVEGDLASDPQARRMHPIDVQLPPGTYSLTTDRPASLFSFAEMTPASVQLVRERPTDAYVLGGAGQWYFYVPKGTRVISAYWSGGPLSVRTADGKLAATMEAGSDLRTIPVPANADGALWRIDGRIEHLYFFNVPNWVAVSPDQLLVPRDVVASDGLHAR